MRTTRADGGDKSVFGWMEEGHPWMSGVWFGGSVGHGYPQQRIFLLDAGYCGH